ncbi:hypothetical protein [Methanopyrus sp.]
MLRLVQKVLWWILSNLEEVIYTENLLLRVVSCTIVVMLLPIRLPYRLLKTIARYLRRGLTSTY